MEFNSLINRHLLCAVAIFLSSSAAFPMEKDEIFYRMLELIKNYKEAHRSATFLLQLVSEGYNKVSMKAIEELFTYGANPQGLKLDGTPLINAISNRNYHLATSCSKK